MSIINLTDINWKEFEILNKKKSIGTIVLSPIEEHGPHLPLGTDYIIANDCFFNIINILEEKNPDYNYLIYPSFALGYNKSISDFPGTFCIRIETIKNLLIDIIENYIKNNIRKVVVFNHHLDLGQIKAIQQAKLWVEEKYNVSILDLSSSIIYSEISEKYEEEIHGDIRETSFMLYRYPHLVKSIYKNLPNRKLDIKKFYKEGNIYFSQMGIKEGYIGNPRKATYENGKKYYEMMMKKMEQIISKYIENKKVPEISLEIKKILNFIG